MRLLFLGDPLATLFTVVYGEIVLYVKALAECRLTCMRAAPASWRYRISHLPISSLRRHRLRHSQARIRAKRGNHWPSEGMRSRRPNVSLSTEKDIKIPSPLRLRSLDFVQEKGQNLQNEHPCLGLAFILLTSPSMRRAESVKHWERSKRGTGRQYRSSHGVVF